MCVSGPVMTCTASHPQPLCHSSHKLRFKTLISGKLLKDAKKKRANF